MQDNNNDSSSAKQAVLQQIIDAMTGHMMGGLKKKGATPPAAMALEIKSNSPADLAGDSHPADAKPESDDDSESPDLLQKLAELYGKDDDEDSK